MMMKDAKLPTTIQLK